jgi:transcription elongation factor GreB
MSRHRPPEETRSNYITPEGAKALRDELDYLWKEERPRVTQAVSEAAAQGDRSENADYIYGKRRLREIDQRVRHLTLRLDAVKVVAAPPTHADRIFFGAWVRLENDTGIEAEYRIVGPDEFDVARGFISMDAPMGRALMGKRAGDEVVVERPAGTAVFTIIEISYRPFTPG